MLSLHPLLQFYPANYITVSYSVIEASIAVSQIIAAPVAAGLLQLSGLWGLAGALGVATACSSRALFVMRACIFVMLFKPMTIQ
jgi:hypothetical protein